MPEITQTKLGATMVHEVPRGNAGTADDEVVLSKDLTPLDAATDRFVRSQMLDPFIPTGRDIIAVPERSSDGDVLELVPRLVVEILADVSRLPEHSRAIAQHLFESQVGAASAGIFLASVGEASEIGDCVVLMKAEHQEGVRLQQRDVQGSVVFEVEHIKELIVGQNSKVYKIAVLWTDASGNVVGKMVDKQNGVAYADYFLDRFLGMQLLYPSEKLTRDLLESATKHINSGAVDLDKRTRYMRALVALMEGPIQTINVSQFLQSSIDQEDRDEFEEALPSGVRSLFTKDVTLVRSRIGGMVLDIEGGQVQVRATAQAVESGVIEVDTEAQRVVISGALQNISPSRPPKHSP